MPWPSSVPPGNLVRSFEATILANFNTVCANALKTPLPLTRLCSVIRMYGAKTASMLAAEFQVCAKTIRDIWSKKTWASTTEPFWNLTGSGLDGRTHPVASHVVPTLAFAAACARVAAVLPQFAPRAKGGGGREGDRCKFKTFSLSVER